MEENKNNGQGTKNNGEGQNDSSKSGEKDKSTNQSNPFEGFDFSKFFDTGNMSEMFKHLLSGGGAVAAVYFLFIKSLEERISTLSSNNRELQTTVSDLKRRIQRLEFDQKDIKDRLYKEREINSKEDYFALSRNGRSGSGGGTKIIRM